MDEWLARTAQVEVLFADHELAISELNERLDFTERLPTRGPLLPEVSRQPTPV